MLRVDCKFTLPSLRIFKCEKNQYRAETSRSSYPLADFRQSIKRARLSSFFVGLLEDPIVAHFLELLRLLEKEGKRGPKRIWKIGESYAGFFSGLARLSQDRLEPTVGTVWQDHLLNLILDDENPFSQSAAKNCKLEEQGSLTQQVRLDLRKLQKALSA